MKVAKLLIVSFMLLMGINSLLADAQRTVDALILPQWHQSNPWNARCPGTAPNNRANAGSHALALAKTMKYWAYPTYGVGSVSYVDDDFGPLTQSFTSTINWDGMSNTLIFQTTQRFIYMCGVAVYTNYEMDFSTSTLANVQAALIDHFSYDTSIQMRHRSDYTNFYWKSLIRTELDAARPVIYTGVLANGNEVAFIVDGYNEAGLFHVNWSNVNYTDGWVDLNELSIGGEAIANANQHMLTGIRPSQGPANIDESFETDFSNWNWQFSGHANWTISSEAAFFGSQSAKSGNINDNQITSMFISINVTQADTISFYKKVSCEYEANNLYDHLAFFIDNVEQQRWSGDGSWAYHQYPVTAGVHEFRWTYVKDGASDYYGDCAWVDAIDLPEGTTPLLAPRFVEAEVINGNDIQVGWSPPDGTNPTLLGYKLFRNGTELVQFSNPAMTSYIDYNLPNGTYTYLVRGVFTEGISGPSNSSSATVEIPYAPTNLTAVLQGINTGLLSWTAPPLLRDRAMMGYLVYRDNVLIAQIENPEATSYSDPGLAEGVYYYEVSALYNAGESARSNTAMLAVGVPEPPANFQAVVNGSTVNLSWGQVSQVEYLTGFKVFRNGAVIANITDPLQLSYSDTNLRNGQYSYYVHAVYTDAESGNSVTLVVRVEVPYAPVNVYTTVNDDDVTIRWTNPESVRALTHYYIYRNGQIIAAVFNPNTTVYLDQSLTNGIYTYQVSAVYSGVESPLSAPVQTLVEVLYPPTNLTASVSLADVSLNWTIPVNSGGLRSFNGYNLYRSGVHIAYINNTQTTHYSDINVANGLYTYEVSAVYSTGESTRARIENILVEVLYPVTALNYQVIDDDVILSWPAAATAPGRSLSASRAFQSYDIYREGVLIGQTSQLTYTDPNLANGFYHYYVVAHYGTGNSEPSPTVTVEVEVLYPPRDLIAGVLQDDVHLSWTAPLNSGGLRVFTGYRVYRDNALLGATTDLVWNDQNLANGTYEYEVVAVYEHGVSQPATVSALVEVLYPPRDLSYTVTGHNSVNLAWAAPVTSGGLRALDTFRVYRDDLVIAETTALSYTDPGIADGHYRYYIQAVYGSGVSASTATVTPFIEYPYPPANLAAVVNGDDVSLSWDVVPGTQVVYHLYRNSAWLADLTTTGYTDNDLANGSYDYYIIVTNASDSGASDPSATANAIVAVKYPPRNLTGTVVNDAVNLSWTAPMTGPRALLNYRIYRDGAQIGETQALTYHDAALANGSYSYYVTAMYDNGESVPSNTITKLVEVHYAPSALTAVVNSDDVTLSWTAAPTSGGLRSFNGYWIYRENVRIGQTTQTTYVDQNLANGTYHYYVRAIYTSGSSNPTNTVTAVVELLYPPSNLSYTTNDDAIVLSWSAAPVSGGLRSFLGYRIYREGMLLNTTQSLTYTDSGLTNGTYHYYVTANYTTGESTPTDTITAILEVLYPATGLTAQVSGDDVTLNWVAPVTSGGLRDLLTYKVLRDGAEIAQTALLTFSDMDLSNGLYQYQVIATYTSGNAVASNVATALVEVLYAPSNLLANTNGDTVNLSWTAAPVSARAFLGYGIYRDGARVATTDQITYADMHLPNGSYSYHVTALYGTGESAPTNSVTATVEVLYPASNLTYSVSDDDVTLTWQAAATSGGLRSFLGYDVYRDDMLLGQTQNLSYTDLNLANGTYAYYVKAVYDSGVSTPTNTVNVLVEVYYPATALNAVVTGDDVALSWTAAVSSGGLRGIQGYKVWRDNVEIAQVPGTTYDDLNLANGVYHYYVTAIYTTGASAPSNTAEAIVEVLYPAANLSYTTNDDDIILTWNAAPSSGSRSFLGYNIYRDGALLINVPTNTYTDASLANGIYEYYVKALYTTGESDPTNTISALMEVLYPATNLSYLVSGDDVTLSWDAALSSGGLRSFLGYKVMRDGNLIAQTPGTTYADNDLANGIYHYAIVASYTTGDAVPTPEAEVLVEVLYPASNLTYQVNGDAVSLFWNPAPNSARALLGYNVYRDGQILTFVNALTFTDLHLANGSYSYYVTALYGTGESAPTNSVTATVEVLYPASNLTYSVADDDVTLTWQAAPTSGGLRNFIGYDVYRDDMLLGQTQNLSYTDLNLSNGTYAYYVKAVYDSGVSTPTNTVNVLVEVYYPATALNAVVTGDDVALSWTSAVSSGGLRGIQGYKVWRDNVEIAQVPGTTYDDLNLANGVYHYYVTAIYTTGVSAPSNVAEAIIEVLYPAANLSYTTNDDDIILTWNAAPSSGSRSFLGYNIYRDGALLINVPTNTYTDASLANGIYEYYVKALYTTGESAPTNTISALMEVLYPATNLSYLVSGDDVTLSWNAALSSGGLRSFLGYKVMRDGSLLAQTPGTTYADNDLANGIYHYTIVASYTTGDAVPTPEAEVLVEVLYPASNLTYQVNGDAVNLFWNPAPNSARALLGYNVYRDGQILTFVNALTFSDMHLANGSYSYYVTALYGTGESAPTNSVTATVEVLYPASNLTYSVNDDDVTLTWQAAPTSGGLRNFIGYDVYRDDMLLGQTQSLSYTDLNLSNGTYAYYVKAVYDSGTSTPTNTVNVLVEVYYPATALNAVVTGDDVALSWTSAVSSGGLRGIQGYKVWRDNVEIAQVPGTTYDDLNLANGVYQYYVTAIYTTGVSAPSNVAEAIIEVLYPAANLTFSVNGDDVTLAWDPARTSARNLNGYRIYRNGAALALTPNLTYTDLDLANGSYAYYVKAEYGTGSSEATNTVNATVEVPYAVTALSASVQEDNVILSWTVPAISNTRAFRGYFIYRNSSLYQVLDDPALNTWTDRGLANGDYSYYLVAIYDAGLSVSSNVVNVTVNVMPDLFPPTGLTAVMIGERDVRLTWTVPAPTVLNYLVYRNGTYIATVFAPTFDDMGLANGSYNYYVKASYAEGLSSASDGVVVNVMIADPPTGFSAQVINGSDVQLTWTSPAQGEIGFVIYRNGAELSYISDPTVTQYVDHGLTNGTYQYRIAAVYSNVISNPTSAQSVTINVAYPPLGFSLAVNGSAIVLSWQQPADQLGLTGYRLYRNGSLYQELSGTAYTDQNLANGTYSYFLRSLYGTETSVPTAVLSGTIAVTYPASGLTAVSNANSISLSWNASTDTGGLNGYDIWRNGSYLTQVNAASYLDTGLANGTYSYYIVAHYSFGNATPSNIATATVEVLYPPTLLSANVIDNDVHLSWTAPVTSGGLRDLLTYRIYRGNSLIASTTSLSYIDQDMVNGLYSYKVSALYSTGESAFTNTVPVTVEIMYPASNLVSQVNGDDVTLTWTAVPASGATLLGYKVYRNGAYLTTTSAVTYTDMNLANGSYSYYVSAAYSSGESSPTNTVTAVIEVTYPASNLSYTLAGNNVTLVWSAAPISSRDLLGYQVYRNNALLTQVSGLTYSDNGLNNGSYSYYVIAVYSAGSSLPSNTVTPQIMIPYVPTGLTTIVTGGNSVNVSWNLPGQSETGFVLYRNDVQIWQTVNPTVHTYTDANLANGSYSYKVKALYPGLGSVLSDPSSVSILVAYPAQNLTHSIQANDVQLSWTAPADLGGFTTYRIYRNGVFYQSTTQTSYTDTDLANGSYAYYVISRYGSLDSAASNTTTANLVVAYPASNLSGTISQNSITLSWTAPADLGGFVNYAVFRNGNPLTTVTTTGYTDQNLANGSYSYYVVANYSSGAATATNTYSGTIRVAYPPQNATLAVTGNTVTAQWQAPTDANLLTAYRLYRDANMIYEGLNLSFADYGLPNDDYSYTVRAVYGTEISNPVNAGNAHVEVHFVPMLTNVSVNLTTVALTWNEIDDAGFFQNYRIYRDGVQVGSTNILTYEDTGLANGTYSYTVSAMYQGGESSQSAALPATVLVAYQPTAVSAIVSGNSVSLNWTAPSDLVGFEEYRIFRDGLLLGDQTTIGYTDAGVSNGTHSYVIGAYYSNGITAPSIPAQATVLIAYAPTNLSGELQANDIILNWTSPTDVTGLTGYNIYRDGVLSWTTTIDNTNYLLDNMPNGLYDLSVSAVYGSLVSDQTPEVSLELVIAYPVPYLFTTPIETNEITLGWNAPTDTYGLTGYRIWRNGTFLTEQTNREFTDANLPNGSYVYTLRSVYGSAVSDSISTTPLVIEYYPLATDVVATVVNEGYRISWQAPQTATLPDHYKVFFLREQDMDDQEEWVFVAETDSLWVVDSVHGGYSHGNFLWAVFSVYGELLAGHSLSNILEIEPTVPPVPEVTKLIGNYPNPFNPETRIVFWLKQNAKVKLSIYNDRGQLVRTLVNNDLTAGQYSIPWDGKADNGRTVNSGVYIYKLTAPNYNKAEKMLLLK